ncbi:transporter [Albimonas pacifica]|uniref:MetA-pathway of phenol degradation n=1 Tax=Albimonas pacifica TaxID=1114924 RepID=A0A1I3CWN4_9RHOB|nr:transporter [Albimonas pacifica]SFH78875.1 hypothetical protein SAMN05216258_102254 [Albimonas pacifica]
MPTASFRPQPFPSRRGAAALAAGLAATLSAAAPAAAQESAEELAKKLANPVASLISVPFQFNWDGGYGPQDGQKAFVNIQPVVPIDLNEDWNLISRTILPVAWQDDVVPGTDQFGLGDVVQSLFVSPKSTASGLIWGVGPVALIPTATDDALGAGKFGLGPTAVVLKQFGPWTVGALANHIWSVAGEGGRDEVNASFVQPFVNYTWPSAASAFLNTEATYDWTTGQWAVPINVGVNQLTTIGDQKVQFGLGARWWAESPRGGPEGVGVRFNVILLFPR